jgi:hypothetical protein
MPHRLGPKSPVLKFVSMNQPHTKHADKPKRRTGPSLPGVALAYPNWIGMPDGAGSVSVTSPPVIAANAPPPARIPDIAPAWLAVTIYVADLANLETAVL